MEPKLSTAYEIRVPTDERSSGVFGYFKHREDGLRASKGKGWYGADGSVGKEYDVVTIELNGEEISFRLADKISVSTSMEEYKRQKLEQDRKSAIAKLSSYEREILGL